MRGKCVVEQSKGRYEGMRVTGREFDVREGERGRRGFKV